MKKYLSGALFALALSGCTLIQYRPLPTIKQVDLSQGYRVEQVFDQQGKHGDDTLMVVMFSGGGTRAAALGYGVLEQLNRHQADKNGRSVSLLEHVDLAIGVSGGSVLAAYFSLHGTDTVPNFERRFLKQNFQRQVVKQVFAAANIPRLSSTEFGRGDLLQEQFEAHLFQNTTFGDLAKNRKGPFAVISATDMGLGERINFTQEYFDALCINLGGMRLARAVAASSSVPLVFAPLTINNNGGNCGYRTPYETAANEYSMRAKTRREMIDIIQNQYASNQRPYLHLIDGGMTDNLGLRTLLDGIELHNPEQISRRLAATHLKRVVIISVNAQNRPSNDIDQSPNVPGLSSVVNAIINIPIDKYSQESLRRFRFSVDQWNQQPPLNAAGMPVEMDFINLSLSDLPESSFKHHVLQIPTSFYLPSSEINDLKQAAKLLLQASPDYRKLLQSYRAEANRTAETAPEEQAASAAALGGK